MSHPPHIENKLYMQVGGGVPSQMNFDITRQK